MGKITSKIHKTSLPVDIKLPERVLLENGTMFAVLKSLDEFEKFLSENNNFSFSCRGIEADAPAFLREDEWVFGNSESAIVHTIMRMGKSGIYCEYFDLNQFVGYWRFKNLPNVIDSEAFLSPMHREIRDKNMTISDVEQHLLHQTFYEWMYYPTDVKSYDNKQFSRI